MEEKEFDYINVIPLVDIMLVLLTIVLVTATFVVQGIIPVNLPHAKYAQKIKITTYHIVITKNKEIFFENRKITFTQLEKILQTLSKNSQITLSVDKALRVEYLVKVLDLLKKYNLNKVYLKTEII